MAVGLSSFNQLSTSIWPIKNQFKVHQGCPWNFSIQRKILYIDRSIIIIKNVFTLWLFPLKGLIPYVVVSCWRTMIKKQLQEFWVDVTQTVVQRHLVWYEWYTPSRFFSCIYLHSNMIHIALLAQSWMLSSNKIVWKATQTL